MAGLLQTTCRPLQCEYHRHRGRRSLERETLLISSLEICCRSFFRKAGSDSESSDESEEELLTSDDESGSDKGLKGVVTGGPSASKTTAATKVIPKASKFLRTSDNDSDASGSGDSEADNDSDEDSDASQDDAVKNAPAKKKPMGSKFLRTAKGGDDTSSDEDEDESDQETVKVVKSAKSKRLDEMEAIEKSIGNGQRINDWASVNSGKASSGSIIRTPCKECGLTILLTLNPICGVSPNYPQSTTSCQDSLHLYPVVPHLFCLPYFCV